MAIRTECETMPTEACTMADKMKANNPSADIDVVRWISLFKNFSSQSATHWDNLEYMFTSGYCWYFAHMLKLTFERGYLAIVAPSDHCVWVDDNGQAYDINGPVVLQLSEELVSIEGTVYEKHKGYLHIPYKEIPVTVGTPEERKFFEEKCKNPLVLKLWDREYGKNNA